MDLQYFRCFGIALHNALKMLQDRGFDVSEALLPSADTADAASADTALEYAGRAYAKAKASGCSMGQACHWTFSRRLDGHSNKICLWLLDRNYDPLRGRERMVSTDQVKTLAELIQKSPVSSHVVLAPCKLSPQAKKEGLDAAVFCFDELMFDLPRHALYVKHFEVSEQRMQEFLGKSVSREQLPWLPVTDPVCRWHDFSRGSIVFVDMPEMPMFRQVV